MSILSACVIGASGPLTFLLMRKVWPYQPPQAGVESAPVNPAERLRPFRWFMTATLPFDVVLIAGWTWVWTLLLRAFTDWYRGVARSESVVVVGVGIWLVPALVAGLVCAAPISGLVARLALRERYDDFVQAHRAWMGFDDRKVARAVLPFLLPFLLGYVFLAAGSYFQVADDSIAWGRLWPPGERRFSYAEVDRLIETSHVRLRDGTEKERPRCQVVFTDGSVWCYEEALETPPDHERGLAILGQVASRSGKPLLRAKHFEDIAGP